MTNGDFILSQLKAFGIDDSDLMIIADDVELDAELVVKDAERAMIPLLAKAAMSPFQKSQSEHGISVTWEIGQLAWWYRFLCKKYGVKPDEEVLEALGLSYIKDATNKW